MEGESRMAVRRSVLFSGVFLTLLGLFSALPGEAQNTAALERQLTKRVDEYYKLLVTGEWRKVQDYITEDSYDTWLAQPKNTIQSYEIKEVKVAPDRKQADVTVMVTFIIPQFPVALTHARPSQWVYQKRQWFIRLATPKELGEVFREVFGTKGPVSEPQPVTSPLVFDQNPIRLPRNEGAAETTVKVPFQNVSSTPVTVKDLNTNCPCLSVEVDKTMVRPQEKGTLTVTYRAPANDRPARPAIRAVLSPSLYLLDLAVEFSNE